MSKYSLEDRVRMRSKIEDPYWEGGAETPPPLAEVVSRIAALEAEDSANPIAQTQQVRPDLRLNIDVAAFQRVYDDLDRA